MSLTKKDIQIIEEIVNKKVKTSLEKYILSKPHILNITYDELTQELQKAQEKATFNIPIMVEEN